MNQYKKDIAYLRKLIKRIEAKEAKDNRNLPEGEFALGSILESSDDNYYMVSSFSPGAYGLTIIGGRYAGHWSDDVCGKFNDLASLSEFIKEKTDLSYDGHCGERFFYDYVSYLSS